LKKPNPGSDNDVWRGSDSMPYLLNATRLASIYNTL